MLLNLAQAATDLDLLAARNQMAVSLGFHIVFAALGIGFPLITLLAHRRGIRHNDPEALLLAKRWSKTMAVLFAVGAVSGTILSFELGILWPGLMGTYGDVIGLPFTLEGVSFFTEAIFIGIYLYGWKRMPAKWHYRSLYPIVAAGIAGSFFIVSVNAWMNNPTGFAIAADGSVIDVDPLAAMFNPGAMIQYVHMLLAAYMVSGFLVAGVYARAWIKGHRDRIHRLGFVIAFSMAAVAAPLQIVVGDVAVRRLIEATGKVRLHRTVTQDDDQRTVFGRRPSRGRRSGWRHRDPRAWIVPRDTSPQWRNPGLGLGTRRRQADRSFGDDRALVVPDHGGHRNWPLAARNLVWVVMVAAQGTSPQPVVLEDRHRRRATCGGGDGGRMDDHRAGTTTVDRPGDPAGRRGGDPGIRAHMGSRRDNNRVSDSGDGDCAGVAADRDTAPV